MSDEEFPNIPNALKPCPECGEEGTYLDTWENPSNRKRELFGRCPKCWLSGHPGSESDQEAIAIWNAT